VSKGKWGNSIVGLMEDSQKGVWSSVFTCKVLGALFFLLLLFSTLGYLWYLPNNTTRILKNDEYSSELNGAIIELIDKALGVHFGRYDKEIAEDIFTEEFLRKINDSWPRFYGSELYYWADRSYMQGLVQLNAGRTKNNLQEYGSGTEDGNVFYVRVTVNVITGVRFTDLRDYYYEFFIVQDSDGRYVISRIMIDT